MIAAVLITSISATSIGFYLRFLVALCKECRPRWICYVLRLQPATHSHLIVDAEDVETSTARAA